MQMVNRPRAIAIITALACLGSKATPTDNKTLVADAIDWYSTWHGRSPAATGAQACAGELRGGYYRFRCDPLAVVFDVSLDDRGRCHILFMQASLNDQNDLHVPSEMPNRTTTHEGCGELPTKDGRFGITVVPHSRSFDRELSVSARNAALQFDKKGGASPCVLRFPKVKPGDPFFHVYEECEGAAETVMEFAIHNGNIDGFPHWTYNPKLRRSLPEGIESRLQQDDLWFGESKPKQRSDPGGK